MFATYFLQKNPNPPSTYTICSENSELQLFLPTVPPDKLPMKLCLKTFKTKLCIMIIFIHIATFGRSTDVLRTLLNTQPRNGTDAVLAAIAQGCAFGSVGEMHR